MVLEDSIFKKFEDIIKSSEIIHDVNLEPSILNYINLIGSNIENFKAVWTVLITLSFYKIMYPNQDIRNHKMSIKNGFSGRSFDTKYVTPTLKKMGLISMNESGWLTRSIEQDHPLDLNFPGRIRKPEIKNAFLKIIDSIEKTPVISKDVCRSLINFAHNHKKANKIEINPIDSSDNFLIHSFIKDIRVFFEKNYKESQVNTSKLPVICIYSLYMILIKEIKRYRGLDLSNLGSHLSADKRSKSSGDIELFDSKNNLIESIEVKHNKDIDEMMLDVAIEKIYKNNPKRYTFLTTSKISNFSYDIKEKIREVKQKHGCQILLGNVYDTLEHYLALIDNLPDFVNIFSENISKDNELKIIHKQEWKKLINKF